VKVQLLPQLTPANEWFWTSGADGHLRIQRPAAKGSWNVIVWLTTPVDSVRWAWAWPTPAWGRIAVPMRKPSLA
jgi:hypothetical protein